MHPPASMPLQQFIRAVAYCHTHNVAHRDLKLDNTLLDDSQPARIKLCDFGFAKQWSSNDSVNMKTMGGPSNGALPIGLPVNNSDGPIVMTGGEL